MAVTLVTFAGISGCATAGAPRAAAVAPYDLVIRNARIVDGTGSPWYRGDLAVQGGRIARVTPAGALADAPARRRIEAAGLVLAPGFIDMLGHSESSILRHPDALSKISQGITSEITGEVESAWPETNATARGGGGGRWSSLGGYFEELERRGSAINLGTYVGAGSVRRAVMGDASRGPTPDEMRQMEALVDSAMRDGAFGFSTGLIYPPTTFFTTEDLVALTRRAARHGGGYASHIRNEGTGLLDAVREAIRIGSAAGTWVQIRHLKLSDQTRWGRIGEAIAIIDSARRAGTDVSADQYPYTAAGTGLSAILPTWAQAGGADSMLARLRDPAVRVRLRGDVGEWQLAPNLVMVNAVRTDSLRKYEGRRLDDIGRERGQDPYEAAYDILVADRGGTSAIYFSMSEDDVRRVMRQPWVSIGQDAGATTPDSTGRGRGHPRGFGTFPRILGRYVREDSVLTLEDAVRKMTALAAARVGLDDRGVLKRGMHADLVLFDPTTVIDRATFERPQTLATGIHTVVVNGVVVLDAGRATGARPGRALRGPAARGPMQE